MRYDKLKKNQSTPAAAETFTSQPVEPVSEEAGLEAGPSRPKPRPRKRKAITEEPVDNQTAEVPTVPAEPAPAPKPRPRPRPVGKGKAKERDSAGSPASTLETNGVENGANTNLSANTEPSATPAPAKGKKRPSAAADSKDTAPPKKKRQSKQARNDDAGDNAQSLAVTPSDIMDDNPGDIIPQEAPILSEAKSPSAPETTSRPKPKPKGRPKKSLKEPVEPPSANMEASTSAAHTTELVEDLADAPVTKKGKGRKPKAFAEPLGKTRPARQSARVAAAKLIIPAEETTNSGVVKGDRNDVENSDMLSSPLSSA